MANIIETELEGFDDLEKQLTQLLPDAVKKSLNAALRAASKPVVEEMKRRVSVKSGTLKKGISASRTKFSNDHFQAKLQIGPTEVLDKKDKDADGKGKTKDMAKDGFYAKFLEFGTSKMHARPFIGPAFDARFNESLDTMLQKLGEAIDEGAQR